MLPHVVRCTVRLNVWFRGRLRSSQRHGKPRTERNREPESFTAFPAELSTVISRRLSRERRNDPFLTWLPGLFLSSQTARFNLRAHLHRANRNGRRLSARQTFYFSSRSPPSHGNVVCPRTHSIKRSARGYLEFLSPWFRAAFLYFFVNNPLVVFNDHCS